jgi:hypothetical protein
MRKRFAKGEHYEAGESVEWQHGAHWLPGSVHSGLRIDEFGGSYYNVTNRKTTRTVSYGDAIRAYPGKIRRVS